LNFLLQILFFVFTLHKMFFLQTPPMGSMLMAKVVPPCGGDTCWSSNIAAYNALSKPFQQFVDGLTAVHDFRKGFTLASAGGDENKWAEAVKKNPPSVHPVVRVHPVSGKKGLFVNGGYTTRIVELSKAESDTVLEYLYAHSSRPDFTVRWKWSVGDVAFWDNRLTQHYALADYMPHRRVMHRATVLGDKPRGPSN
jgi:taurine dioxygenase